MASRKTLLVGASRAPGHAQKLSVETNTPHDENCPTTGILDFVGSDGASWEVVTERVVNCAEINSTAWRWDLTTRLSQHARRVVAPTHWLISTQIIKLLTFVEGELAKEE